MRLGHYRHVSTPTLLSCCPILADGASPLTSRTRWEFDFWLAAVKSPCNKPACHVQWRRQLSGSRGVLLRPRSCVVLDWDGFFPGAGKGQHGLRLSFAGVRWRGRAVAVAGVLSLIPFVLLWGRIAEARHWRLDTGV